MRHDVKIGWLILACAAAGCGGRAGYWNTPVSTTGTSFGLANGVALVDDGDHRVVMLTAEPDEELSRTPLPIGHNVTTTVASPDGQRLFVLSAGDWPQRSSTDEAPSLTVVDASTFSPAATRYTMQQQAPLANLAIDPYVGAWAVAYAGSQASSFVQNANAIVLFDLTTPGSAPIPETIQSFGGAPRQLTFTPPLTMPDGQQEQLLIVETDVDVTLMELGGSFPQVTIQFTNGTTAQQVTPAGVVVDTFDPTTPRIALRASDDTNVFVFTLGPPAAGASTDFTPTINLTDVLGVPSDMAFVRTDAGLRLGALVPSTSSAVLVDPDTSVTTQVALPGDYSNLSLVTGVVDSSSDTDVALLWNADDTAQAGVALWSLGDTVGKPYQSVEVLPVSQPVAAVDDVSSPNDRYKVLETSGGDGFVVLDLVSRTAAPLQTETQATLSISPDGQRLWAFAKDGTDLAAIESFSTLTPIELSTDLPIDAAYDVARPPQDAGGDGGRSLVAIHAVGTMGATVFDALTPDTSPVRRIPALLLEENP